MYILKVMFTLLRESVCGVVVGECVLCMTVHHYCMRVYAHVCVCVAVCRVSVYVCHSQCVCEYD